MRFLKWLMKWWKPADQQIEYWAKQRQYVNWAKAWRNRDTVSQLPYDYEDDIGPFDIKPVPPGAKVSFFKTPVTPSVNPETEFFAQCMRINTQLWAREILGTDFISKRTLDWFEFAGEVARHVEYYTIAQYGDEADDDQANDYTVDYCFRQVKKYTERFGRNQRPGQQELDFFKMAHYIQLAMGCYNDEKKNN